MKRVRLPLFLYLFYCLHTWSLYALQPKQQQKTIVNELANLIAHAPMTTPSIQKIESLFKKAQTNTTIAPACNTELTLLMQDFEDRKRYTPYASEKMRELTPLYAKLIAAQKKHPEILEKIVGKKTIRDTRGSRAYIEKKQQAQEALDELVEVTIAELPLEEQGKVIFDIRSKQELLDITKQLEERKDLTVDAVIQLYNQLIALKNMINTEDELLFQYAIEITLQQLFATCIKTIEQAQLNLKEKNIIELVDFTRPYKLTIELFETHSEFKATYTAKLATIVELFVTYVAQTLPTYITVSNLTKLCTGTIDLTQASLIRPDLINIIADMFGQLKNNDLFSFDKNNDVAKLLTTIKDVTTLGLSYILMIHDAFEAKIYDTITQSKTWLWSNKKIIDIEDVGKALEELRTLENKFNDARNTYYDSLIKPFYPLEQEKSDSLLSLYTNGTLDITTIIGKDARNNKNEYIHARAAIKDFRYTFAYTYQYTTFSLPAITSLHTKDFTQRIKTWTDIYSIIFFGTPTLDKEQIKNLSPDTLTEKVRLLQTATSPLLKRQYAQLLVPLQEMNIKLRDYKKTVEDSYTSLASHLSENKKELARGEIPEANIKDLYAAILRKKEEIPTALQDQDIKRLLIKTNATVIEYVIEAVKTLQSATATLHTTITKETGDLTTRVSLIRPELEEKTNKLIAMINGLQQYLKDVFDLGIFGNDTTLDIQDPLKQELITSLMHHYAYILLAHDALEQELYEAMELIQKEATQRFGFLYRSFAPYYIEQSIAFISVLYPLIKNVRLLYLERLIQPYIQPKNGTSYDNYIDKKLNLADFIEENVLNADKNYIYERAPIAPFTYQKKEYKALGITPNHAKEYEKNIETWKQLFQTMQTDLEQEKSALQDKTIADLKKQLLEAPLELQSKKLISLGDLHKERKFSSMFTTPELQKRIIAWLNTIKKNLDPAQELYTNMRDLEKNKLITPEMQQIIETSFVSLLGAYDVCVAWVYDAYASPMQEETKQKLISSFTQLNTAFQDVISLCINVFVPLMSDQFKKEFSDSLLDVGQRLQLIDNDIYIYDRLEKDKKPAITRWHKKDYTEIGKQWLKVLQDIKLDTTAQDTLKTITTELLEKPIGETTLKDIPQQTNLLTWFANAESREKTTQAFDTLYKTLLQDTEVKTSRDNLEKLQKEDRLTPAIRTSVEQAFIALLVMHDALYAWLYDTIPNKELIDYQAHRLPKQIDQIIQNILTYQRFYEPYFSEVFKQKFENNSLDLAQQPTVTTPYTYKRTKETVDGITVEVTGIHKQDYQEERNNWLEVIKRKYAKIEVDKIRDIIQSLKDTEAFNIKLQGIHAYAEQSADPIQQKAQNIEAVAQKALDGGYFAKIKKSLEGYYSIYQEIPTGVTAQLKIMIDQYLSDLRKSPVPSSLIVQNFLADAQKQLSPYFGDEEKQTLASLLKETDDLSVLKLINQIHRQLPKNNDGSINIHQLALTQNTQTLYVQPIREAVLALIAKTINNKNLEAIITYKLKELALTFATAYTYRFLALAEIRSGLTYDAIKQKLNNDAVVSTLYTYYNGLVKGIPITFTQNDTKNILASAEAVAEKNNVTLHNELRIALNLPHIETFAITPLEKLQDTFKTIKTNQLAEIITEFQRLSLDDQLAFTQTVSQTKQQALQQYKGKEFISTLLDTVKNKQLSSAQKTQLDTIMQERNKLITEKEQEIKQKEIDTTAQKILENLTFIFNNATFNFLNNRSAVGIEGLHRIIDANKDTNDLYEMFNSDDGIKRILILLNGILKDLENQNKTFSTDRGLNNIAAQLAWLADKKTDLKTAIASRATDILVSLVAVYDALFAWIYDQIKEYNKKTDLDDKKVIDAKIKRAITEVGPVIVPVIRLFKDIIIASLQENVRTQFLAGMLDLTNYAIKDMQPFQKNGVYIYQRKDSIRFDSTSNFIMMLNVTPNHTKDYEKTINLWLASYQTGEVEQNKKELIINKALQLMRNLYGAERIPALNNTKLSLKTMHKVQGLKRTPLYTLLTTRESRLDIKKSLKELFVALQNQKPLPVDEAQALTLNHLDAVLELLKKEIYGKKEYTLIEANLKEKANEVLTLATQTMGSLFALYDALFAYIVDQIREYNSAWPWSKKEYELNILNTILELGPITRDTITECWNHLQIVIPTDKKNQINQKEFEVGPVIDAMFKNTNEYIYARPQYLGAQGERKGIGLLYELVNIPDIKNYTTTTDIAGVNIKGIEKYTVGSKTIGVAVSGYHKKPYQTYMNQWLALYGVKPEASEQAIEELRQKEQERAEQKEKQQQEKKRKEDEQKALAEEQKRREEEQRKQEERAQLIAQEQKRLVSADEIQKIIESLAKTHTIDNHFPFRASSLEDYVANAELKRLTALQEDPQFIALTRNLTEFTSLYTQVESVLEATILTHLKNAIQMRSEKLLEQTTTTPQDDTLITRIQSILDQFETIAQKAIEEQKQKETLMQEQLLERARKQQEKEVNESGQELLQKVSQNLDEAIKQAKESNLTEIVQKEIPYRYFSTETTRQNDYRDVTNEIIDVIKKIKNDIEMLVSNNKKLKQLPQWFLQKHAQEIDAINKKIADLAVIITDAQEKRRTSKSAEGYAFNVLLTQREEYSKDFYSIERKQRTKTHPTIAKLITKALDESDPVAITLRQLLRAIEESRIPY